ncbi:hypothetical protein [Acinetobacter ursingii]|jgi:hypothetical protein|uniref:Uncharacterized protein n=1 Tax=Acinetobacter ursingii TaxID=108980 RepID=A0AA46NRR1_9GAMM|nr:hypothetical protein [Acinetobacter ursingii]UYF73854.1 hypothetical protein LSO60_18955 [Acinetobacter ursingii]
MKKILVPMAALFTLGYSHAATVNTQPETVGLTTSKGSIEVKTDEKTVSLSKAPNSPLINTVTTTTTEVKTKKEIQTEPTRVIPQVREVVPELSNEDLSYINAVNQNEKINHIESKIANNEPITQQELKIIRTKNPNY